MSNSNSIGQIFNFVVFLATLVIFINNVIDFRDRAQNYTTLDENLHIIDTFFLLVSSFVSLYLTLESPYDDFASFFNRRENSYLAVIYFVALLFTSGSTPINDAEFLFNKVQMAVGYYSDKVSNVTGIVSKSVPVSITNNLKIVGFGSAFIQITNYSKLVLLGASFVYFAIVVINDLPDIQRDTIRQFTRTIPGRLAILLAVLFNAYVFVDMLSSDADFVNDTIDNIRAIAQTIDEEPGVLLRPETIHMINDVVIAMLAVSSLYIIGVYEQFKMALLPLFLLTLRNMQRANIVSYDDVGFTVLFSVLCFIAVSTVVFSVSHLVRENNAPLYEIINVAPSILYKAGHILSVAAIVYVVISLQYGWFNFEFRPSGFAKEASERIESAIDKSKQVISDVQDIAIAMDPCMIRLPPVSTDETTTGSEADTKRILLKLRRTLAHTDSTMDCFNCRVCDVKGTCDLFPEKCENPHVHVDCIRHNCRQGFFTDVPTYPYEFRTTLEPKSCRTLRDAHDALGDELRDASSEVNNAGTDECPASLGPNDQCANPSDISEIYVSQACRDAMCTMFVSIALLGLGMAANPFSGSGPGLIIDFASQASLRVFKIGRKMMKISKRLIRRMRKVAKLANRVRKLAIVKKGILFAKWSLILAVAPVIINGVVSLVLIMFRRRVYVMTEYKRINNVAAGITISLGMALPMLVLQSVFLAIVYGYPHVMHTILVELPDELVEGEMIEGLGYSALKLAYFMSTVGTAFTLAASVIFTAENGVWTILDQLKLWTKNVIQYIWAKGRRPKLVQTKANPLSKTVEALGDWKLRFLQPLLISLPVLYIMFYAHDYSYVNVYYNINPEGTVFADEADETINGKALFDSTTGDLDDVSNACDVISAIVKIMLEVVGGGISAIMSVSTTFTTQLQFAIDALLTLRERIANIASFPRIEIPVSLFASSKYLETLIVFFLPLVSTGFIAFAWGLSLFGSVVNIFNPFTKTTSTPTVDDVFSTVSVLVFALSTINIFAHILIGRLVMVVAGQSLPFVDIEAELGYKHYLSMGASLLNIVSAISVYVNSVVPIE